MKSKNKNVVEWKAHIYSLRMILMIIVKLSNGIKKLQLKAKANRTKDTIQVVKQYRNSQKKRIWNQ